MPPFLTRSIERVRTSLAQIGTGQKIVIGLLVIGLALGAVLFTRFVTAPTYAPLFSNLASTDASAIVDELNSAGVKYELEDGGQTIMVDRDKVYDTRLQMSSKGLPAGGKSGYALLDEQGITTSEFQQRIDYQRALESEMSNTLEALDGVRTAVVHVVLPEDDVFVTETSKPTASVLLDLAPGTDLSASQIQAVTHLVSSSVEDLSPEQVTVADNTGQVLSAAGSEFGTAGAGDIQSQTEGDYEKRLAANSQEILDRIVGPGKAIVRVRADLNFDTRETKARTYTSDPKNPPLAENKTSETYTGGGNTVGGILGSETPTTGGGGTQDYKKNSETRNNPLGETIQTTKDAPGTVDRLTVSVLVDQRNVTASTPDNLANIQELVSNAVGLNAKRGDAITVATMPLDTSAATEAAKELAAAKKADQQKAQSQMIRTGVIGGLLALIVLIAWLRSRKRRKFEPEPAVPLSAEQAIELDTIRAEIAARQAADGASENASPNEVARRQQVRTEIATMISDSPDEVAAMLRGWLAEEKS